MAALGYTLGGAFYVLQYVLCFCGNMTDEVSMSEFEFYTPSAHIKAI
jgi:hypothetical protein